jgi:hypothetical protein
LFTRSSSIWAISSRTRAAGHLGIIAPAQHQHAHAILHRTEGGVVSPRLSASSELQRGGQIARADLVVGHHLRADLGGCGIHAPQPLAALMAVANVNPLVGVGLGDALGKVMVICLSARIDRADRR